MGDGRVLRSLVDHYFEMAVNDPTLNFTRTGTPYAWEPNPGNIATLKEQYFNYLSSSTGGPAHYSGPPISAVHQYLNITPEQFARSLDLFQQAAQSAGVRPKEQQELITILTNQMLDVLGKNAIPTTQPTRH